MQLQIFIKILQYSILDFVPFAFALPYTSIFIPIVGVTSILQMFGHNFLFYSCSFCQFQKKVFYDFVQSKAVFAILYIPVKFYYIFQFFLLLICFTEDIYIILGAISYCIIWPSTTHRLALNFLHSIYKYYKHTLLTVLHRIYLTILQERYHIVQDVMTALWPLT